ncbi:MAG: FAD-dependent thymidylate synthase [Geothrix sp.]|nr:FAD-dependent thymidylate synthase [Geothrix sp.]
MSQAEITVLDKGFVRLVDHMGSDLSVVNAARVSFGKRKEAFEEGDAKLVEYLAAHEHTSPFRHTALTLHVKAPIFVFRQWMKHRIGCLTGDTVVSFVNTNGMATRQNQKTLDDLWRLWTQGQKNGTAPEAARVTLVRDLLGKDVAAREIERLTGVDRATVRKIRDGRFSALRSAQGRVRKMKVRVLNEASRAFQAGRIRDIVDKGVQPVYRLTLADGKHITLTESHRILTAEGWATLKDAVGLVHHKDGRIEMARPCSVMVNGVEAYRDGEWLRGQREAGFGLAEMASHAGCSPHTIRKWLKVHGQSFRPEETRFQTGVKVWNQGLRYKTGPKRMTEAQRARLRAARSGARSNFWRGGAATLRQRIAAWTARQAPAVHVANGNLCQVCGHASLDLHAHHIIPVWMDPERALDVTNLASVCGPCHREVHRTRGSEQAFAVKLRGPLPAHLETAARRRGDRRLLAHGVSVISLEYVGPQQTYDLCLDGDWHNFVANGMVVHNSEFNEISGRYVEFPEDEFFVPATFRQQAKVNKQGSEGEIAEANRARALASYLESCRGAVAHYKELLSLGVCREQARCVLPVALYSEVYWTVSLQAVAHFIRLRADGHAQWEIQQYAAAVRQVVEPLYPVGLKALLAPGKG